MGLEIFVQFFEGGEAARVSAEAIAGAFGSHLEREGGEWRRLRYRDVCCEIFANEAEGAAIDGFMVSGPVRDQGLWEDLVRVVRLGHGVLYWPSENPTLIVADAATAADLPTEMVEGMGGVTVVSGGAGVMKELEAR